MTQWQSVKKDRALSSDKKINPNFIAPQKNSVLSSTASLKSKCNLFENNKNKCIDSIWITINKCRFQSKFVLCHKTGTMWVCSIQFQKLSIDMQIWLKNLMLSCLNFQSRVGQYIYIGKNKNDYSSISFCIYS